MSKSRLPVLERDRLEMLGERMDVSTNELVHVDLIKAFCSRDSVRELVLPSAINRLSAQKSFLSRLCEEAGVTASRDRSGRMVLTKLPTQKWRIILSLSADSLKILRDDYLRANFSDSDFARPEEHVAGVRSAGRLAFSKALPNISHPKGGEALGEKQKLLPIYEHREEILGALQKSQVITIVGERGCGKTTQVPQYILEQCRRESTPCRIVSVQPRHISVVAAHDRVAAEEGSGGSVGFHSRLESKAGQAQIFFCTTGVMLSSLAGQDQCLDKLTHVIIDEVHCRDRYTDLLLAVLRSRLQQHEKLRLVLLCDSSDPNCLSNYFNSPVVRVTWARQPVSLFYLEDILAWTRYVPAGNPYPPHLVGTESSRSYDDLICKAWFSGSDPTFHELMSLVTGGEMSIDYQHSKTGVTILLAAASHGKEDIAKWAIAYGADPVLAVKGLNSSGMAGVFRHRDLSGLLKSYIVDFNCEVACDVAQNHDALSDVLDDFYAHYSKQHANLDLILDVLNFIHCYSTEGAILVFLPGYIEVVELRDLILASELPVKSKVDIHTLHSHIVLSTYKKMFLPPPEGKRKLILATNMAQTAISFDDVVCVIDVGLFRERENDTVASKDRQTTCISKASPTPSQESLISQHSAEDPLAGLAESESDPRSPFVERPFCIYSAHTSDVLDVSWSKNYFILSSSMDKTVRLWHISRKECLCCFQHIDFVTAIAFHPRDDRYFLSGSLDGKLRLWNIPDKKVALWNELDGQTKLITAANFCQNGKFAVVGSYDGRCVFYTTEHLKYYTQIHVRSTRGKNSKGRKISGIESLPNEDKILVTSNDSRIRLYDLRDLNLSCKYKGYVNNSSQIRASFSHDGKYIISGSENQYIYMWKTHHDYAKFSSARRDRNDYWEAIKAHNAVVTSAVFAPDSNSLIEHIEKQRREKEDAASASVTSSVSIGDSLGASLGAVSGSNGGSLKRADVTSSGYVLVSADFNGCIKVFVNRVKPKHSSLPVSALS